MNPADRQADGDSKVDQVSRGPVSRILFGLGSFFFFSGYALMFLFLKAVQEKSSSFERLGNVSILLIFLALIFWVLAPFFSQRSLVLKIVLSIGMVIFWVAAGDLLAWIIKRAAGVSA